ncbi:Stomatin-like protein 2, mitochondrial [Homalodisca vitripennis]|nr:Stomatin-like protein 2, mitochondrial [Homalodisca vitripennis]
MAHHPDDSDYDDFVANVLNATYSSAYNDVDEDDISDTLLNNYTDSDDNDDVNAQPTPTSVWINVTNDDPRPSKSIPIYNDGKDAASLTVAEQYVEAFHNLAKTNNTLILPANAGDISSAVAHAMTIYGTLTKSYDSSGPIHRLPQIEPSDTGHNRAARASPAPTLRNTEKSVLTSPSS